MLNYAKQIFYGNQKTNINIVDIRTDKSYNFSLSLRGNNFFYRRHFYCISIGDCNQLEGLVLACRIECLAKTAVALEYITSGITFFSLSLIRGNGLQRGINYPIVRMDTMTDSVKFNPDTRSSRRTHFLVH